jgi:hypothetical protein
MKSREIQSVDKKLLTKDLRCHALYLLFFPEGYKEPLKNFKQATNILNCAFENGGQVIEIERPFRSS